MGWSCSIFCRRVCSSSAKAAEELRLLQEVLAADAAGPLQPPVGAVLPGLPRPSPRRKEQRRIRSLKTSSRYSEALC